MIACAKPDAVRTVADLLRPTASQLRRRETYAFDQIGAAPLVLVTPGRSPPCCPRGTRPLGQSFSFVERTHGF